MAAGDIKAITVPATGNRLNITFDSMNTAGTWDLGPWTNNSPTGATIVLTVECPGYDAAGASDPKTRTIYGVPHQIMVSGAGTTVMRKAWVGAFDPVPDETVSGSDMVAVIFLSGVLHASDTITNISIAAGTYNDGIRDNNAYNADPVAILTYSTTRAYPASIFSWDTVDGAFHGDLIGADFRLAAWAKNLYGVAAVRFTVTDQSANELDVYVDDVTQRYRANGKPIFNHRSDLLAIATFDQGENLTLRGRVYPVIGDVVFDTASYTTLAHIGYGRNQGTAICNKTGALTVTRYVAASGGSDANDGLTAGTPYATFDAAISVNANRIYAMAGNHTSTVDPGTRIVNTHWYIIQPAPGESAATVSLAMPANSSTDLLMLQFQDITIKASAANCRWVCSAEDMVRCKRVVFDRNGQAAAASTYGFNQCPFLSFEECSGDPGAKWNFQAPGGTGAATRIDGTDMELAGTTPSRWEYVTLCAGMDSQGMGFKQGTAEFAHENAVFQNVAVWNYNGTNGAFEYNVHDADGVWIENLLLEVVNNGGQAGYLGTNKTTDHFVMTHSVHWGNRTGQFYNDTGTNNFQGTHTVLRHNYIQEYGTKHDDFSGGPENAARVGHWEHMMAVESGWDYVYDAAFPRQFAGLHTDYDDGVGAPEAAWVDDASNSGVDGHGDGTGNGDYRDTNTTTNRVSYTPAVWEQLVPYDRTGRSRGTGCVSAGGYMYRGSDLPVPNAPTSLAQV